MLICSCTGAQRHKLPTGSPSQQTIGAQVLPRCSRHRRPYRCSRSCVQPDPDWTGCSIVFYEVSLWSFGPSIPPFATLQAECWINAKTYEYTPVNGTGRPPALDAAKRKLAVKLYNDKNYSVNQVCQVMGISKPTLYKYVRVS